MSVFIGDKAKRVELAERKDAINPNLFSNTDEMDKFWQPFFARNGSVEPSTNYASDTNYELIATKSIFHAVGPTAATSAIVTKQQIYFEPGLYTISFLARNNGTEIPSFTLGLYSDYTDTHGGTPVGSTNTELTNIWQKYSITFKIIDAGTYSNWRLLNNSALGLPGGSLYFANLKLECGPVATQWCPAYDDYARKPDIASLQNAISNGLAGKADKSQINIDGPLFKDLTQFNNWGDLFDGYGAYGVSAANASRLVAFRDDTNGVNTVGANGAGIAFGGSDTKGVLSVRYDKPVARIAGGNGTSPVWHEDIAWKSDITTLANRITALENKKPIKANSQDDAVAKSKNSNDDYYW